jgi:hypothetical protein
MVLMNKNLMVHAAKLAYSRPFRRAGAIVKNKANLWEEAECTDNRDRILLALINKSYTVDLKNM